jgi:hypothetical protein
MVAHLRAGIITRFITSFLHEDYFRKFVLQRYFLKHHLVSEESNVIENFSAGIITRVITSLLREDYLSVSQFVLCHS